MKIPDFKMKDSKDEEGKLVPADSNQTTCLNIIYYAVSDKFSEKKNTPQGEQVVSTLSGSQGRMWGRIQTKFEDAIDTKAKNIDLETSEIEFIKSAMEKATFPVVWFKWTILIEDALAAALDKGKK